MIKEVDGEQVCAPDYLHDNKPEGCHEGTAPPVQPGPNGSYPVPVPVPSDPAPSPTLLQAAAAFGGWWAAILIRSP